MCLKILLFIEYMIGMGIETILISEPPLIPVWFYSYSAIVYLLSAIIGFLVSYFSFRLYRMSSVKLNLILSLAFLALGFAFLSLTITSLYTYFYLPHFKQFQNLGLVNRAGFNFYYIASLIGYLLILMIYLPKKVKEKFFILYVPLWYTDLTSFHMISILFLSYVVVRNIVNFVKRVDLNSFLVMFAFISMIVFHILLLQISFSITLYLLAHSFLTIGFGALLFMLIRVSRK